MFTYQENFEWHHESFQMIARLLRHHPHQLTSRGNELRRPLKTGCEPPIAMQLTPSQKAKVDSEVFPDRGFG